MFAGWLLVPLALAAEDTVRAPRLELAQVYEHARAQNPRALAARALAAAALARVPGARRPPDPQLQLGFMNYSIPQLDQMDGVGMTQLQVMQMIPVAGKLRLSGRTMAARADAAQDRANDVSWQVRERVAMAFYELHATDRALDVARRTLRLVHDARATAEAMYRVGDGRQADVLRAQVEIARMVEDTTRMRSMRLAMAANLNALLDRAADADVPTPALPRFPAAVPSLDSLLQRAAAGRPMLAAARRDLDAAVAQQALMRREIWPDVTVGVQYGQRGSAAGTERMGSLMLGASVPVFAASRQHKLRDEAAAMTQMASAELTDMLAGTREAVVTAHAALLRARNLAALYRTTIVPQAEAASESALAAYRVGSVDFMTLLDDRMTVNKYRQELVALEAEEGKAWAQLEMLLGHELFDPGRSP